MLISMIQMMIENKNLMIVEDSDIVNDRFLIIHHENNIDI